MDYTAIIVSFMALLGVTIQTLHNNKQIKKQDIKKEIGEMHNKLDAVSNGQEYVLQDRLLYLCEAYIRHNRITSMELKMLSNMYHAYHDLGGNDFITELYDRVKELPLNDGVDE